MEMSPGDGRPGGEGCSLAGNAHGADVGGGEASVINTAADDLTYLQISETTVNIIHALHYCLFALKVPLRVTIKLFIENWF